LAAADPNGGVADKPDFCRCGTIRRIELTHHMKKLLVGALLVIGETPSQISIM
jgi:hypothetical protein